MSSTELALYLFTPIVAYCVWRGFNLLEMYTIFRMRQYKDLAHEKKQTLRYMVRTVVATLNTLKIYFSSVRLQRMPETTNPTIPAQNRSRRVYQNLLDQLLRQHQFIRTNLPTNLNEEVNHEENHEEDVMPPLENDRQEAVPTTST